MNNLTINATASEINREHAMAIAHAGQALDHAKRAGELLLAAKAQLPHGQFSEWVLSNVMVSTRQAQRYMAAAQGKPTPLRAIIQKETKNDTVSHLPTPQFIPENASLESLQATLRLLADENDALRFRLSLHASDATEEEKAALLAEYATLVKSIDELEAERAALKESRNAYQFENAQLKRDLIGQRKTLAKLHKAA